MLNYVIDTLLVYCAVVIAFRLFPNRASARLNNYDWIVTVVIGAAVATTIFSPTVSVVEGVAVIYTLLGVQWLLAACAARSEKVQTTLQRRPKLLVYRGELLDYVLKQEHIHPDEVESVVRQAGYGEVAAISAVVLEPSGAFTVLSDRTPPSETLDDLADQR